MSYKDKRLRERWNKFVSENREVISDKNYQLVNKVLIRTFFNRKQIAINDFKFIEDYMLEY